MKRFLEQASRIIGIDSTTERGNEELVNYLSVLMQNRGLKTSLQNVMHSIEGISKRQFNVVGIMGTTLSDRKIKKGLLLTAHLDTVKPGLVDQWDKCEGNPLKAHAEDDQMFGLGVADAKIDFLAKLYAIHKFREKNLKMPIYLLGTCGEELGMFGAKYFIQSYLLNPKFVLVGKPTGLKAVNRHKGVSSYSIDIGYHVVEKGARGFNRKVRLKANGRSNHSAFPLKGVDAIQNAMSFINQAINNGFELKFTSLEGGSFYHQIPDKMMVDFCLTSHQVEDFRRFFSEKAQGSRDKKNHFQVEMGGLGDSGIRFLPEALFPCLTNIVDRLKGLSDEIGRQQDKCYDPPIGTLSIGGINQTAQQTQVNFDLRLLPETDEKEILEQIIQTIQGIAEKYPLLNVSVKQKRSIPGMIYKGELTDIALEVLSELGLNANADCGSFCSEASLYNQKNFDVITFGPGMAGNGVHAPDERISISEVEKAVSFYEAMIARICL